MKVRRLWLLLGSAVIIAATAGVWVYDVMQRPASAPPNRVGPWSLGDAFDPPKPAAVPPAPKPNAARRAPAPIEKAPAPAIATRAASPVEVDRPARTAAGAGGAPSATPSRPAAASKPLNMPVIVPHPDQSGLAKLFVVQQRRSDTYVPGDLHGWIGYDITFDKPMVVRAGGELRAGSDAASPGGMTSSAYERDLARRRADFEFRGNERVLRTAPYLALIGRVCSRETCSTPFMVGAGAVLCPSPLGVKGELQLWTNNYVRVEGFQTLMTYSRVSGGYRFQTEPAPPGACDAEPAAAGAGSPRPDAAAIDAGQALKDPGFVVSSRQTSWKPFFLPLDRALVIRASGYMQPREAVLGTDPNGIVVPAGRNWTYPGTSSVTVDGAHALFDPRLPYQALIGRLCNATSCSDAFLVGSERTICPTAFDERLELWVNHIVQPTGTRQFNLDVLAFQSRRGEYKFEVSRAPAAACGR